MYSKELRYYFSTPIAYIVIGLYLSAIGLFLWVIPGEWNIAQSGYAQVEGLFELSPWLLMLLCPALTMRLFAEERQTGTWSMLRSKPMALWRIVSGKYFASWTVVLLAQLPCVIHYFLVYWFSEPIGNIDSGAFFGSFIGLIFLSASFCAIGLWSSSVTKSQIVAFVGGAVGCFVMFYGFDLFASMFSSGGLVSVLKWFGMNSHYLSVSEGVIDLRDVVYFVSVSAVFVVVSIQSMRDKA